MNRAFFLCGVLLFTLNGALAGQADAFEKQLMKLSKYHTKDFPASPEQRLLEKSYKNSNPVRVYNEVQEASQALLAHSNHLDKLIRAIEHHCAPLRWKSKPGYVSESESACAGASVMLWYHDGEKQARMLRFFSANPKVFAALVKAAGPSMPWVANREEPKRWRALARKAGVSLSNAGDPPPTFLLPQTGTITIVSGPQCDDLLNCGVDEQVVRSATGISIERELQLVPVQYQLYHTQAALQFIMVDTFKGKSVAKSEPFELSVPFLGKKVKTVAFLDEQTAYIVGHAPANQAEVSLKVSWNEKYIRVESIDKPAWFESARGESRLSAKKVVTGILSDFFLGDGACIVMLADGSGQRELQGKPALCQTKNMAPLRGKSVRAFLGPDPSWESEEQGPLIVTELRANQ